MVIDPFETPWGTLEILHDPTHVRAIRWRDFPPAAPIRPAPNYPLSPSPSSPSSPLGKTLSWLQAFVSGIIERPDLPLKIEGTAYQRRVWQALDRIEPGRRVTYRHLAQTMGEGSPRSLGGACRANRFVLVIPCHRVVGARGNRGYAGGRDGIAIQTALLEHERLCERGAAPLPLSPAKGQ